MRKAGFIAALFVLIFVSQSGRVYAEACKGISGYGAVNLEVPTLPGTGDYNVWARLKTESGSARLLVEVNQQKCLDINSDNLKPNKWQWLPYSLNNKPATLNLTSPSGNFIKVIGTTNGLKFDQIILARPGCVPVDLGENCAASAVAGSIAEKTVKELTPPSEGSVSGKVVLSPTPTQYAGSLKNLSYSADGRMLQSSDKVLPFDTTLLNDGKHTILINTTLNNGRVISESVVIQIDNPDNVMSPIIRYIRLNKRSILYILGISLLIIGLPGLVWFIRHLHKKRRERHFHGF